MCCSNEICSRVRAASETIVSDRPPTTDCSIWTAFVNLKTQSTCVYVFTWFFIRRRVTNKLWCLPFKKLIPFDQCIDKIDWDLHLYFAHAHWFNMKHIRNALAAAIGAYISLYSLIFFITKSTKTFSTARRRFVTRTYYGNRTITRDCLPGEVNFCFWEKSFGNAHT